jgi:hypothetical protein
MEGKEPSCSLQDSPGEKESVVLFFLDLFKPGTMGDAESVWKPTLLSAYDNFFCL